MAALAREGAKSIVTCVSVQQRSIETGIIERNEALSINSQQNPHYYCSVSDANYSGGLTQDRTRHAYMEYTCLDSLFYAGWLLHFFHVPSLIITQLAVSSLLFSSLPGVSVSNFNQVYYQKLIIDEIQPLVWWLAGIIICSLDQQVIAIKSISRLARNIELRQRQMKMIIKYYVVCCGSGIKIIITDAGQNRCTYGNGGGYDIDQKHLHLRFVNALFTKYEILLTSSPIL